MSYHQSFKAKHPEMFFGKELPAAGPVRYVNMYAHGPAEFSHPSRISAHFSRNQLRQPIYLLRVTLKPGITAADLDEGLHAVNVRRKASPVWA